jgi:hypothetical protein
MGLPFSQTEFFAVMAAYNQTVWPAQIALEVGALAIVALALRRPPNAGAWTSAILAILWAWTGLAYHWAFFAAINPAAWAFGAICLAAAVAFAWFGVVRRRIGISPRTGARGTLGWALIAFALVVYPALGVVTGHPYPTLPTFGLPCPTTIFTVGVLLLTSRESPRAVYVVPALWSAIGASAAFLLGVYADLGLLVSGVIAVGAIFSGSRSTRGLAHATH